MGRFKITELDHIVLNVGDIDRSLKFYTRCLGLEGRAGRRNSGPVRSVSRRCASTTHTIIDLFPRKTSANVASDG